MNSAANYDATFGERVEDFFLITDRHDAPLGIDLQDRLLHALLDRLGTTKAA